MPFDLHPISIDHFINLLPNLVKANHQSAKNEIIPPSIWTSRIDISIFEIERFTNFLSLVKYDNEFTLIMKVVLIIFFFKKDKSLSIKTLIQVINKAHFPAWLWDINKQDYIFISDQLLTLIEKITNKTMTKNEIKLALDKNTPHDLNDIIQEIDQKQEFFYSYFVSLPNGDSLWLDTSIIGVENKRKKLELVVGFITERNESNLQERNHLPRDEDPYTGLPNLYYGSKLIEKKINQSESSKQRFALVKIVASNIPNILNSFGYDMVNQILSVTSKRLTQFMHDKGLLFHVYTDGWFALIHDVKNIREITRDMIKTVQDPLIINGEKTHVIANAGISLYPDDGRDVAELMKHTTNATSAAVKLGPGKKDFYLQEHNLKLLKQAQLTRDLFEAIQKNELYLEYQPKIDVKSLAITGTEALIRWKHPIWGNVSPVEFIPLIKEIGLEENFTAFVIEQAIRQLKEWEEEGISNPKVSINISPDSLLQPSLYPYIERMLKKHKVSPKQLEIELTEDIEMGNDVTTLSTIKKMKELGMSIALDDMGAGFTSIYDLADYKINTVKIDRRGIDELESSETQRVIIEGLVKICSDLNIKTVVEGVERKEQFDLLRELGCDEIQGFYFSPSVSAQEMKNWFQLDYAVPIDHPKEKPVERRKYFRVDLIHSLIAEMKILTIKEKEVVLKRNTKILVQNIGPGGLMFLSYLDLPVNDSIVYEFAFEILGSEYSLVGKVKWNKEYRKEIYAHGIEFQINENERERLTSSLFKLSSIIRNQPTYTDKTIIEDDPVLYLRKLNLIKEDD